MKEQQRRVSFSETVAVGLTYSRLDYDRSVITVDSLTSKDIVEMKQMLYAMRQSNQVLQKMAAISRKNRIKAKSDASVWNKKTEQTRDSSNVDHQRAGWQHVPSQQVETTNKQVIPQDGSIHSLRSVASCPVTSQSTTPTNKVLQQPPPFTKNTQFVDVFGAHQPSAIPNFVPQPASLPVIAAPPFLPPPGSVATPLGPILPIPIIGPQVQQQLPFMNPSEQLCNQQIHQMQQFLLRQQVYLMQYPCPYYSPIEGWC